MRNDTLTKLIEQAAGSINTLNPKKDSELKKLQKIFDNICMAVDKLGDSPEQLLGQIKDTTCDAVETLQKILTRKIKATKKSINSVSEMVAALQELIEQIAQTATPAQTQPAENTSSACKKQAPEEMIISQDDVPLILDFITESTEHLDTAEAALLELEAKPDNNEVLNLIFRGFHTIKGMAGFLNLSQIGSLSHSAENLLNMTRKGQLLLTGNNTDIVFESIDTLKKMISNLQKAIETGNMVTSQKTLPDLLKRLKATAEGQAAVVAMDTTQAKADDKKPDEILQPKETTSKEPMQDRRAGVEKRERTDRRTGLNADQYTGPERRTGVDRRTVGAVDEKIKISIKKLDKLINMAGELVVAQLMVSEETNTNDSLDHALKRKVAQQGKIVRELQELSMSMRMVPISSVFQKMARLVRDLSRKDQKKIKFVTVGEDTELDRSIVDKIADPLVHMVRNSIDHGIESAEDRAKTGKNPEGTIELRAFHQAGNIVIEIEDDGKGLDKERILQKAIDNGVVEPDAELTEEQIYKLVFHAGLSTAEKITSISGRGVGMDVVKKNIYALQGKIDISSTRGKGTIFTIRMPLTLAIIDGQIVKIGDDRYIIPIISIVNTLKPKAQQLSSVQGKGEMVMIRGQIIPLVRLYKLFGSVPKTEDPTEALVVLVQDDEKKCCLMVDQLLGQQQVVIKNLGEGLGQVKGVLGGSIMGDGKVSLILDIPGLMELAQK